MFIGERAPHEARDGDPASPLESRTRSRVLHMVSAEGPITAAELGRHLDLTPAAVRRHLDALVEQGAVVEHEPTGARGAGAAPRAPTSSLRRGTSRSRPTTTRSQSKSCTTSPSTPAPRPSPTSPAPVWRALEESYAAELAAAGDDPTARAETLVDLLTRDGFAASARPVGAGAPLRRATVPGPLPGTARGRAVPDLLRGRDGCLLTPARGSRPTARHPGGRTPRVHHLRPGSGLARKPRWRGGVDPLVSTARETER